MAVILPASLLQPLPVREELGFVLDRKALTAVHNANADDGIPRLPVGNIIRAFQLQLANKPANTKPDAEHDHRRFPNSVAGLLRRNPAREEHVKKHEPLPIRIDELKIVRVFLARMEAIRKEAEENGEVVLFHFTNEVSAGFIVKTGLRMSTQGQGDGGVYFITMGPLSFQLGTEEFERLIIENCFGKERMDEYLGKNMLSHVIVASIDPTVLSQVPGGRENAFAVSRHTFETLAMPSEDDGAFYLPLERIKACFHIHTDCTPCEDAEAPKKDVEADKATQALLVQMTHKPKPLWTKIEWAAEFNKNKFNTTIRAIKDGVGPADELVYYFTSHAMAIKILDGEVDGLPALKRHGGVRFSVFGPHERNTRNRRQREWLERSFDSQEVCLMVSRVYFILG